MQPLNISGALLCLTITMHAQSAGAPPQAVAQQPESAAVSMEKLQARLAGDEKKLQDWANLKRYAGDNAKLAPAAAGEERVVFMGDSITDAWGRSAGTFFPGKPYVNRGISGQTTPQMLIRFRPDVIDLKPRLAVILAGTNDIAGNTGPMTLEQIEGNLASMAQLAQANNIRLVMASVMPVCDCFTEQTQRRPPEKIVALNRWIAEYASSHAAVYLDYYTAMADEHGFLKKQLTGDGLHPNDAGYAVMSPLAAEAIRKALGQDR